jgi:CRP/FNR family transcriptional regulator
MNGSGEPATPSCTITDAVKQVRYSAGDALFIKGEKSCCLHSVTSGLVKIINLTPDGREQIIGLSNSNALLAGLQTLSEAQHEYTAIAATDVSACKLRVSALLATVKSGSDIAVRLVNAINSQLAHSRALMRVLGHRCAAAKIASFIRLLIPESQHGNAKYTLPLSRGEMANMLGLSEETVCRQMAKMKRRNILYAPRGRIEVHDWDQLKAIANESVSLNGTVH